MRPALQKMFLTGDLTDADREAGIAIESLVINHDS